MVCTSPTEAGSAELFTVQLNGETGAQTGTDVIGELPSGVASTMVCHPRRAERYFPRTPAVTLSHNDTKRKEKKSDLAIRRSALPPTHLALDASLE